jgi:site-specific recombinase
VGREKKFSIAVGLRGSVLASRAVDALDLSNEPEVTGPPSDDLPSREEFLAIIGTDGRAAGLLRVLLTKCRPDAPLPDLLIAVEQLGRFIVAGPNIPVGMHPALARLELLIKALEKIPAAHHRFQETLRVVLSNTRGIKLFGEIGLPNDRGLWAETTDRLARRFLPEPPAQHELWMLASKIIRKADDLSWLGPAADPFLHRLAALGGDAWAPLRASIEDALGLIATRCSALGMTEAFRMHTVAGELRGSPLYQLTRAKPQEMPAVITAARQDLNRVREALEDRGVSIDVVYSLDSIEQGLTRIELLLPFVDDDDDIEPTYEIRAVIGAVGKGLAGGRSFMQLMNDNLRLLARKVIERAGKSGEHYVTSSRREYFTMYLSAAGGGVLTTGTAAAKFLIKWGHWPLFVDGMLSSLDYAASFVIMQLLGCTLATKQPSMTAAALAGTIRDRSGPGRLDELVRLIARIARSQFAAAMGNVSAVIVTSLVFDLAYQAVRGHTFLDVKTSAGVISSFDPFGSGTIFFAALTGVLLWLSSLAAGWFENWVVYRRLPEAIEHHRWAKSESGKRRMSKLARFLEHQSAGFGGSVALGIMLGMVPVFGKFFGLPLEVRHITLSTGSLTLAMNSIGLDAVGWSPFLLACLGIVFMGLLNFGVSFALALVVALRARDVPRGERRTLPLAVMRRFFRKPAEFFYPPKENANDQSGIHPPAH